MESEDDQNIVTWDSPTDPANPINWPSWRRWTLICLVSSCTFVATLASSMFAPGVGEVMQEFGVDNDILSSFVITIFVLGLAFGPLFFAPLSELYGRLVLQHVGNIGFVAFTVACAVATDLGMLIVFRLFVGIFSSVFLTNGGGIIADMVRQEERGFALAMFTVGVLLGPVVGPVSGGYLGAAAGWRWIFWVIAILGGVHAILCFVFWKESYPPVLLERKAARLRRETANPKLRSKYDNGLSPKDHFKHSITRVCKFLIYSPIVLSLSLHMGLVYSYFYLLLSTLTPIFQETYGWTSQSTGLAYLGLGAGFLFGQALFAKISDRILRRMTRRSADGEMKPEYRLPPSVIGGCFVPIGLLWYGWAAQEKAHYILPIIATGFMAFGNCLIFMSIQAYCVDGFTIFAASALAATTVVRSVFAGVFPLAAPRMYAALGIGWGNTLLAGLALLMVPVPQLLMTHGEKLRKRNVKRMENL
ncbi:MFS general substrate transporter [Aulographum hederae CBS 113979]|uniref:MFS general substrate transporter n=1 Tax=Aulographum hederae CBS 113979 TaxID=1176131 RepID=A0A6G1HGD0_9PEZI|nr:MFS general substrate transporter [Aulographum hederae CBS 113979]